MQESVDDISLVTKQIDYNRHSCSKEKPVYFQQILHLVSYNRHVNATMVD